MRTVHIHIGADNLFTEFSSELTLVLEKSDLSSDLAIMSERSFVTQIKQIVDAAQPANGEEILAQMGLSGDVLISRPKLLFTGQPMTVTRSTQKALYKINALQRLFANCKLVFHLVVTDQVSYLSSHLKWLQKNRGTVRHNWRGLCNAIEAKLVSPNELLVWNAEDPVSGKVALASFLLGVNEERTVAAFKKIGVFSKPVGVDDRSMEDSLKSAGMNIEVLDVEFERDIDALNLNPLPKSS